MNFFTILAAAGMALGITVAVNRMPTEAVARTAVPSIAEAPATANRFVLSVPGSHSCAVTRAAIAGGDGFEIHADANCDQVLPGLAQVRFWQEREDGSVIFSRDGADELVSFGAGDGVAYESFQPAATIISMNEAGS